MSQAELDAAEKRVQDALARLEQTLTGKDQQTRALQEQIHAAADAAARQAQTVLALTSERDALRDKLALLELDQSRLPLEAPDAGSLRVEIAQLRAENQQLRATARDAARRVNDTIGRLRLAALG